MLDNLHPKVPGTFCTHTQVEGEGSQSYCTDFSKALWIMQAERSQK